MITDISKKTKRLTTILLSAASFLLYGHTLSAQTLDDYLRIASENNPSLKASYQEYYAALQRVPQAGTLPDPQLTFSMFIGKDGLFMERFMGEQLTEISVMQMFPWAGTLDASKNEASYMAQMKFNGFVESRNTLYHGVRSAWYRLYKIDKELGLLLLEKDILKAYEQLALTRFKTGTSGTSSSGMNRNPGTSATTNAPSGPGGMSGMNKGASSPDQPSQPSRANPSMGGMSAGSSGSMVDVLLIQLQIKELETRMTILNESKRPLEVKFNNLLNRPVNSLVVMIDTLTPAALPASLSVIQDSIVQNHPMLKMYEWDEKAREAQLRMAKLMGRPMIGVGLTYMVFRPRQDELMNTSMGGENMFMPMVTVTLPLYRKKYNAQRNEASYLKQTARYNREAALLDLFSELEELLFAYQNNTQQLRLLEQQIEITEQAIRLMITAYATGNYGMEEILRQRQSLLNYRQQQLAMITEQHVNVSAINKLMGR